MGVCFFFLSGAWEEGGWMGMGDHNPALMRQSGVGQAKSWQKVLPVV